MLSEGVFMGTEATFRRGRALAARLKVVPFPQETLARSWQCTYSFSQLLTRREACDEGI